MTLASHARGLRFEPGMVYDNFFNRIKNFFTLLSRMNLAFDMLGCIFIKYVRRSVAAVDASRDGARRARDGAPRGLVARVDVATPRAMVGVHASPNDVSSTHHRGRDTGR